jgi:hypothetical protein
LAIGAFKGGFPLRPWLSCAQAPDETSQWRLAIQVENVHTFGMTLKNAAFFALVGMLLWTIVLTARLVIDVSGVVNGIVPAVAVLTSLVEWVAGLSLFVFFLVFHGTQ